MEESKNESKSAKLSIKTDSVDRQILNDLYNDGRQSPVHMEIKSSSKDKIMSHTGIKNRISNLIDTNILKIQGNVNINAFDFQLAFIKVEFNNPFEKIYEYIDIYGKCPRIFLISRITGQFHLYIGVIGKNLDDLNNFLNFCLLSKREDVKSSEITFASEISKPNFYPLNIFNINNKHTNCGKNCEVCEAFSSEWCFGCNVL